MYQLLLHCGSKQTIKILVAMQPDLAWILRGRSTSMIYYRVMVDLSKYWLFRATFHRWSMEINTLRAVPL